MDCQLVVAILHSRHRHDDQALLEEQRQAALFRRTAEVMQGKGCLQWNAKHA
jgi:hypothetical protein